MEKQGKDANLTEIPISEHTRMKNGRALASYSLHFSSRGGTDMYCFTGSGLCSFESGAADSVCWLRNTHIGWTC